MSLLRRISSLHVCNVITGWLWASVNKKDAQSLLEKKAIIVWGWLLIVRLAAEFIIAIPSGWAELILICFWKIFFFPPPGSTGASSPYHYWNIFHFIRLRHAPMWCPRSWRHYTLHNNTQARLRCLSIKIQSGHKVHVSVEESDGVTFLINSLAPASLAYKQRLVSRP